MLIATSPIGGHPFSRAERSALRDVRKQPIRIGGYAVSSRRDGSELRRGVERWRAHVRIDRQTYVQLRDFYLEAALRRTRAELEQDLHALPFEPYAPVRRQLLGLVRKINERRKVGALLPLRSSCLRFRRKQVRPFDSGRSALGVVVFVGLFLLAWRFDAMWWALTALVALVAYRAR